MGGPGDTPAPGAADGTSPHFSAARCTVYLVVVLAASVMATFLSLACWADHHSSGYDGSGERAVIMTRVEGKAEPDGAVERTSDWDPEFMQMLKDALGVDIESTDSSTGPGTWRMTGTTSSSRTPSSTQIVEKLTSLRVFGYMTGVRFMLSNEIRPAPTPAPTPVRSCPSSSSRTTCTPRRACRASSCRSSSKRPRSAASH